MSGNSPGNFPGSSSGGPVGDPPTDPTFWGGGKMQSYTTAQRDDIGSEDLKSYHKVVYNSDDNELQGYINGKWITLELPAALIRRILVDMHLTVQEHTHDEDGDED